MIYKTKAKTKVYCKKEELLLLDESAVSWLKSDVRKIKDSQLIATPAECKLIRSWEVNRVVARADKIGADSQ